jgi:trehalose 6-phosphate phosphatase
MSNEHSSSSIAEELAQRSLAPLRARPERSALVFDVDGTLAPIVSRPEDAAVPDQTRGLLVELSRRYALVACVSGRRAADARRVVGLSTLTYVGNHGLERLGPGAEEPEALSEAASYASAVRSFANAAYSSELRDAGIRIEDKGSIWSFHWRQAPDESIARAALEQIGEEASQNGLVPHWGRKVLEIRPPIAVDKGSALRRLLARPGLDGALYGGDDTTDLDAFRGLRDLRSEGSLEDTVCVGIGSDEAPAAILDEADLVVEGPDGFRELLALLAR